MLRLAYIEDPWNLEMNRWHRQEFSKYCSEISKIETDRGLTLNNNKSKILKEIAINYLFLFKVGIGKLLSIKKSYEKPAIYNVIKNFNVYEEAVQECRALSIIRSECKTENISLNVVDGLLTVGTFFYKLLMYILSLTYTRLSCYNDQTSPT